MSDLKIGIEEIDHKYEILEKMTEGGMGEIFKARHRLLDEVRVIKTIHAEHRESVDLQARFRREAKVAIQLQHPGIAQLHDFSLAEDGTACIVMEFIDGTDLAEASRTGGPPSTEDALEIARQTLSALRYLHAKKIVHRDISPDNIMVTRDFENRPTIKLIDLGIAKSLEATQWKTRTGTFIGKVKYASPEQLQRGQAGDVDGRSDLYSFGVVLYELLTDQYPIEGTDEASILAGHLLRPPRDFAETDPDGRIPPALRAVLLKALEKNPEHRLQSAEEFLAALSEAERGIAPSSAAATESPASAEPGARAVDPTVVVGPATEPEGATDAGGAAVSSASEARPAPPRRRAPGKWAVLGSGALVLLAVLVVVFGRDGRLRPGPGGAPPLALAGIDFGRYHALVVGNDAYDRLPQLKTAANDARAVGELLERRYGFQVRVLTDASRYDMITALTDIGDSMTERDNLLIYYAGHGFLDSTNQTGYWQPIDAEPANTSNWISTKHEVSAVLSRVAARHILVVADSCYSGTLADAAPGGARPDLRPPAPGAEARRRQVEELLERRSRLALTSGGLSPVLDQGDGMHSIFARVLLDVLARNPNVVEVTRLFGEIERRVPEAARGFGVEQSPQLASISRAGDEGGEFFFVPLADSGRPRRPARAEGG